jgi:hypothetical protein
VKGATHLPAVFVLEDQETKRVAPSSFRENLGSLFNNLDQVAEIIRPER